MITQSIEKIANCAVLVTTILLLSGCASQSVETHDSQVAASGSARAYGEQAANIALQQVGVPYRYGGTSRAGFDCSGLVQYSYKQAGLHVPRTTGQLWSAVSTVEHNDLRAGDLLFFEIEGKMSHVGMYVGKQQFVHAPSSGRTVTVADLSSPFYAAALIRAGRPR